MTQASGNRWFRPAIREMDGYIPGEQPKINRLIKLNTNENPYPPSPKALKALADFDPTRLNRYPTPLADPVRQAAAELTRHPPDWILVGNGSDDILTIATRSFVEQGGTLACLSPSYSLYAVLAQIQGARCVEVSLTPDFQLPETVSSEVAQAPLFYLTRPNAPTGGTFPLDEVRRFCRRQQGIVLIDEAYADFADDHCLALVRELDNVLVSRTLSKGYALAGIRLGYVVGNPDLITGMMKVKDSYNVNTLTQQIAAAALQDQAHLQCITARIRRTREKTAAALRELDFEVTESQANFLFIRPPLKAADFQQALRDQAVLVRYFPGPITGEWVRVTMGTDKEMEIFLHETKKILQNNSTS